MVKNMLKQVLVPALASRPVSTLASRVIGSGIPIFMLHRMRNGVQARGGTRPEHLRRCLAYLLESGHHFVSLEELIVALRDATPLPDKPVAFTMDDGYADQAQIAAPIFLEFGCPVTFFVITDMLDNKLWPWDEKISWISETTTRPQAHIEIEDESLDLEFGSSGQRRHARHLVQNILKEVDGTLIPRTLEQLAQATNVSVPDVAPAGFEAMDWETARSLERQGIRFAPHTRSHRILSRLDPQSARQEIMGSWARIEEQLASPLKVFCYPTGRVLDYGSREVSLLKEEGFLGAVSTIAGVTRPDMRKDKHLFGLPRLQLPDSMTDFIQYCTWIEYFKERRGR